TRTTRTPRSTRRFGWCRPPFRAWSIARCASAKRSSGKSRAMSRARAHAALLIVTAMLLACGGGAPRSETGPGPGAGGAAAGRRSPWLQAECTDSPLDLARLGFEREVELSVRDGVLLMTFDTEVIADGCPSTSVVQVLPGPDPQLWRLEPQAIVTLPAG